MASTHQQHVADYHAAAETHHGGHNMYLFHRDWHANNRDPVPPTSPNLNWGMNNPYGGAFLQMHHEMVRATDQEQHLHMMHQSIAAYYASQVIALPALWSPRSRIPTELGYEPDVSIYPPDIRNTVIARAQQAGRTPEQLLTRTTDTPGFELPKYFTRQGVAPGEPGERFTGARKLADFKNTNQLGCCIVFPHNSWHGAIGGAMGSTWTAIADPIFYFGVHWHIDQVYKDYLALPRDRLALAHNVERMRERDLIATEDLRTPPAFKPEDRRWIAEQVALSERLNAPL